MKVREFQTVAEAVAVLSPRTIRARIEALEKIGVRLDEHTHRELAERVCSSREHVTRAMTSMGRRRSPPPARAR